MTDSHANEAHEADASSQQTFNGKSANGSGSAGHSEGTEQTATTVASFKIGYRDSVARLIEDIYFKHTNYVIYCTGKNAETKVLVQYASDDPTSTTQIAALAEIIPLRNHLQSLLAQIQKKERYYADIAEALRLSLEGKLEIAKQGFDRHHHRGAKPARKRRTQASMRVCAC
jgi:hypothetical protein